MNSLIYRLYKKDISLLTLQELEEAIDKFYATPYTPSTDIFCKSVTLLNKIEELLPPLVGEQIYEIDDIVLELEPIHHQSPMKQRLTPFKQSLTSPSKQPLTSSSSSSSSSSSAKIKSPSKPLIVKSSIPPNLITPLSKSINTLLKETINYSPKFNSASLPSADEVNQNKQAKVVNSTDGDQNDDNVESSEKSLELMLKGLDEEAKKRVEKIIMDEYMKDSSTESSVLGKRKL